MAEKRVLTNPDILNIILSFAGVTIQKQCIICGRIIKYQILNQEIENEHKSYINFETCEKIYFCNEDCLYVYNQRFRNKRICVYLFLIFIFSGIIMCIIILSW